MAGSAFNLPAPDSLLSSRTPSLPLSFSRLTSEALSWARSRGHVVLGFQIVPEKAFSKQAQEKRHAIMSIDGWGGKEQV